MDYEHYFNNDGATRIPFEDVSALRQPLLTLKELDEAEANNIRRAMQMWEINKRRPSYSELLTLTYAKSLHLICFGMVWDWAGMFRNVQTNIGIEPIKIQYELKQALENINYKISLVVNLPKAERDAQLELIVAEFAYKIVWIHPFKNGNGRWSRVYADRLADVLKIPRFSWGKSIPSIDLRRNEMLNAICIADSTGDIRDFLSWVKK